MSTNDVTTTPSIPHPSDPEVVMLLPEHDVEEPILSIVVPALNEELTIEEFVAWCHEGLATAGVRGEIVIIDSSTDRTPELAVAAGARVLRTPKRGLGRAYIDSLPMIRGQWVLMGDADCTYDFRELVPFVEGFRADNEFVMGSRWKGSIEKGAMPALHQYFGTPFTTWILNVLYSSHFSDIHCGMRGLTTEAFRNMGLESQSWEYASEMVLKSVHMGLRTTEVPVRFLKDKEGRVSHHKRMGWFSPFSAAWINLRAMFVYGADFFLFRPGICMLLLGLLMTIPLIAGPVTIGAITFSVYWMFAGLTLTTLGIQSMYLGMLAQSLYDYDGTKTARRRQTFRYTRTAALSFAAMFAGLCLSLPRLVRWISDGFTFTTEVDFLNHLAIFGIELGVVGFTTFTFMLVLHAIGLRNWGRNDTTVDRLTSDRSA
jgi:glycosyltransferase involved in cell wall biosynthesis